MATTKAAGAPATTKAAQLTELDITKIYPSPTNPRKHFDEQPMKELADSISKVGVQQPVKVRPCIKKAGMYELVYGERRYRASKLAGLKTLPALIQELDDDAVIEIQTIENLHRADIHPLDEAEGFRMLQKRGNTIQQIADKVHKSQDYIYKRIRLADLVPEAKTAMYADNLPVSYGIMICGYTHLIQTEILNRVKREANTKTIKANILPSLKDLREEISNLTENRLEMYAFDKTDVNLNPNFKMSCDVCPKNIKNDNTIFGISKDSICTDAVCLNEKNKNHCKQAIKAAEQSETALKLITTEYSSYNLNSEYSKSLKSTLLHSGSWKKAKPKCPANLKGLMIDTDAYSFRTEKIQNGQIIPICITPNCPTCSERSRSSSSSSSSSSSDKANNAAHSRYVEERKLRMQELESSRAEIAKEILLAYTKKPNLRELLTSAIFTKHYDELDSYQYTILSQCMKIPATIKKPGTNHYDTVVLKEIDLAAFTVEQLQLLFLVNYLTKFRFNSYQNYERYKTDLDKPKDDRLALYADLFLDPKLVKKITEQHKLPRKTKPAPKQKPATKSPAKKGKGKK